MPEPKRIATSKGSLPVVNIGWIHPFLEILDEVGIPSEGILREANLPVLATEDGSVMVPTDNIYRLVNLATRVTRLPDLGFRAGNRIELAPLLPAPEQYWSRPGVFRTLESFINVNLASTSHGELWVESKSDKERTIEFFYKGTFGRGNPAFPTVEQFMVALMVRFTRFAAGPGWCPDLVNLRATSVPEEALRKLVGESEVRCSQTKTSIVFPGRRWVDRVEPIPPPDSKIWKRHRRSLQDWHPGDDLAGSLRLVLGAYLPDGSPGIELAAKLSGTTVRTLQRRLKEQGISYSQLLDDLRHDLAVYLLRDPDLEASAISRELGYRDPAIFTRAFRRWRGTTPSEFRKALFA
jgi:AraC-like DNA-binding protein